MATPHTFIPARILLVCSLLATGGLGHVVSIETGTEPIESSGARSLESTGLYIAAPVAETSAVGSIETIDPRYVRHGRVGPVDVYAESDALFADAVWALSRFNQSHMPLPKVRILVSAEQTECKNSAAYLTHVGVHRDLLIRACGTRTTLLHELGHAWDLATLSDERRNAFMKLRGLESWSADTWGEAAGEHAATIIAWGLSDRAYGQVLRPNDVASMREGFVLLTGSRPLWERAANTSDHGLALNPRSFVGETDRDEAAQVDAAAPQALEERTPELAARLRLDAASVRELTKPALRAVAGDNGRGGFLVEEAAGSFNAMKQSAASNGVSLSIVSSWRSWRLQDRAYQQFLATGTNLAGNPVPNVAHPDISNHPKGLAIDFALQKGVHEWLRANAARFGWYPISSEDWHWEYRGGPEWLLRSMQPTTPPPLPVDDVLAALDPRIA